MIMFKLFEAGQRVFSSFGALPERRLHNQARAIWSSSRRGNAIPALSDFDFRRIDAISEHGFLLEISQTGAPLVTQAGDIICEEAGQLAIPVSLEAIPERSLLWQFASRWEDAVRISEPVNSEYEFVTEFDFLILCRGVLLPLSTDGRSVDHVYGVITWTSRKVTGGKPNVPRGQRGPDR